MPRQSPTLRQLEKMRGLPPGLLGAVIQAESGFNPQAISPAGAIGLAQFMPATAQQYGIDPLSPLQSAQGAAQMLGELNQKYGGSLPHVLASYNWGTGNVDRKGLQSAPDETRNYISKILNSLSPIGQAAAADQPAIPSREEFMRMKQQGQIPEQQPQKIPTREEFMMMKQAGEVPTMDEPVVKPVQEDSSFAEDAIDYLGNVARGFAARGNQAFAAINPFADQERIKREQEWIKQHSGAGLGSGIADAMILAPLNAVLPGAGFSGAATRALGTGIIEAGTKPGDLSQKAEDLAIGTAGGAIGEGLSGAVKFLNKPVKGAISASKQALVKKAQDMGLPINLADRTGSKAAQYAKSALETLPISSSMEAGQRETQRKAWTAALMREAGENADTASPEVMGAMKDRISSMYDDIAGRNELVVDAQYKNDLAAVANKYLRRVPVNQRAIVRNYINDLNIPDGAFIDGRVYQETRSMLDRQARALANSDPVTSDMLSGIRSTLDDAFARNVSPADKEALSMANKQWGIMRTMEKAIDPLSGDISPKKFLSELTRREKNRVLFGKGNQDLIDIARVGAEFVSPRTPSSGTAERSIWQKFLQDPLMMGGGGYLAGGPAGALAGLAVPPAASYTMWHPGKYLTEGLVDLAQPSMIPPFTRGGLLDLIARESGIEATR